MNQIPSPFMTTEILIYSLYLYKKTKNTLILIFPSNLSDYKCLFIDMYVSTFKLCSLFEKELLIINQHTVFTTPSILPMSPESGLFCGP